MQRTSWLPLPSLMLAAGPNAISSRRREDHLHGEFLERVFRLAGRPEDFRAPQPADRRCAAHAFRGDWQAETAKTWIVGLVVAPHYRRGPARLSHLRQGRPAS